MVFSSLVYLAFVKKTLDEQATRREPSDIPQTLIGAGPAGQPETSEPQDGVGAGGAAAQYPQEPGAGAAERVDRLRLGAMGGPGVGSGAESAGSGRPAGEAVSPEDHGRDRRAGGQTDEGGITTGKESDSVKNLEAFVNRLFDCQYGPYQSWVEHEGAKIYYVTLGFMTHAPKVRNEFLLTVSNGNALQLLRQAIMSSFLDLRAQFGEDKPRLYWRYHPEWRFLEEIGTSDAHIGRYAKIMTRIAVPGADWEKVRGFTKEGEIYERI